MYLLLMIVLAVLFALVGSVAVLIAWALAHWALPALVLTLYVVGRVGRRRGSTLPPTRCNYREEN